MIKTRKDLLYYIKRDMYSRFGEEKPSVSVRIKVHDMVRFNKILRKAEYHLNNNHKLMTIIYKMKLLKIGTKLGWSIDCNSFGPGLCIVHYGTVVVNSAAKIGENARLQAGVNIGASGGSEECPVIGDNVYFGPGAKVFGNIKIASNIAIASNAVVNKSCYE